MTPQRLLFIVALIVLSCAACISPEERAAQRYAGWRAACDGDADCIHTMALDYEAQQTRSLGMTALGLQMMQASTPAPRQRLTCTTTGIYTNCW